MAVQETTSAAAALKQLVLTSGDCAKLMPDGSPDEVRPPAPPRAMARPLAYASGAGRPLLRRCRSIHAI